MTGIGFFLDDRDYAHYLISTLDIEAQLMAMNAVLRRNEAASAAATVRIRELETAIKEKQRGTQRAEDERVDEIHSSVYSDAAASMAAIGMFAPLLESIFQQTFRSLGLMYAGAGMPPPDHERWKRPNPQNADRWNSKIYFGRKAPRGDVALGISQLIAATGLSNHVVPEDLGEISALFLYRNHMFHMGFEWPLENRRSFQSEIEKYKWEKYFTCSTSGDDPWIYYLQDQVVADLPAFVDQIVLTLGRFARELPHELLQHAPI